MSIDTKALREMREQLGEVEWGAIGHLSLEEMGSLLATMPSTTRECFGDATLSELHGVYLKGGETALAVVGNSPNSPCIARILTGLWNAMPATLDAADRLAALESENRELRDWIRERGNQTCHCTFDVLREVCAGCLCERALAGAAV